MYVIHSERAELTPASQTTIIEERTTAHDRERGNGNDDEERGREKGGDTWYFIPLSSTHSRC